MPAVIRDKEDSESSSEDEQEDHPCIAWSGLSRKIPILVFCPEAIIAKDVNTGSVGERYNMAFKIVRTESRLVRGLLTSHGFHEVHPNSDDFNLMWTGSHLKPYLLRSLQDFQKVNHFPRSYELTRKDRLYKNIQRMQQAHGFKNFHIIPQTFVLPSEYQEFCSCFAKDKGPWIIKPVASSRGRGIYLVSNPSQISMDENILVSRYINNPLLIDDFKFDVRLYVLVTSYDPLLIYVYEEGLARFATVKYDRAPRNIKNQFMHLTNYSVNKKSSDYVSCDDPEVEDYGNKWSMSAMLRYLKQEGKDTALLMSQVEDLIIKAVLSAELQIATACKMFAPYRTNCFGLSFQRQSLTVPEDHPLFFCLSQELYGFDVLIDSNLKPWLLEVNLSPSLACDAPLDLKIKASMISDMFSLVGIVCQNPLLRQPRSDRFSLESSLKHPAQRTQRQRPVSATNQEAEGVEEKLGCKPGQGDSTLGLTAEEIKVLRRIKEENERRGGFIRIFPTPETWGLYGGYIEFKTSMNSMLASRLFHGRNINGDMQLQADMFHSCHVFQYERKLLSLEARKRRQYHSARHSAVGKRKSERECKASPTESSGEDVKEEEKCVQEERKDQRQAQDPVLHKAQIVVQNEPAVTPQECIRSDAPETAVCSTNPKFSLLDILQQGWDLSKVQARMAFSSYLRRVQHRLLAESSANITPALPEKDNDQMELVIRFLKRAASNLQQDMKMVLPSCQLPLQDRRRLLSHQLGEFIHCYNKETEYMVKKQENCKEEKRYINPRVFQEYITEASENDLEEVLTFYTHRNKSASVFLGPNISSNKKEIWEKNASAELVKCENTKILPVARETSSASESSLSTGKVGTDPDPRATGGQPSVPTLPADLQAVLRSSKSQPKVQASQHSSSFPSTLDFTRIHLQHCCPSPESLPLHCPPPPPPPQPPSYAQSTAKTKLQHPPQAQANTSTSVVPQPPSVGWMPFSPGPSTAPQPPKVLRRIQSFTSTSSRSNAAAASSMPSAAHIYSQRLCRPTSANQVIRRSSYGKPRLDSVGVFKELNCLSAQAQFNQQAIVSALQKLADKQAARHYTSSSHINLLTQHLTNLNLANGMLNRRGFPVNPKERHTTALSQGPMRAVHSDRGLTSNTGHKLLKDEEGLWDEEMQSTYGQVTGVSPQQHYQPTQGSYQLQFAIQQLQQQRLQSRQLLDQSRCRLQALLPNQTNDPRSQASTASSSCPPASHPVCPSYNHSHIQSGVGPIFTPKPPCSSREGLVRKTATQRLNKPAQETQCLKKSQENPPFILSLHQEADQQTSSESLAHSTPSSGQHVVFEAVQGKTGLSVYSKLLQGQAPKHR